MVATCQEAVNNLGSDGNEKEVRFGRFIGGRFVPGVNKFIFDNIIQQFEKDQAWVKSSTVDKISIKQSNARQVLRKIETGNSVVYQLKEKLYSIDVQPLNIRVASAREQTSRALVNVYNSLSTSPFVRNRNRITFKHANLRLDLTRIDNSFEVELEFTSRTDVCKYVDIIRAIIQKTLVKGKVVAQYRTLTGTNRFVGPLPRTLTKNEFSKRVLSKTNYAVTDKADGERYLYFVDGSGVVSFISRKMDILITNLPMNSAYKNTIVDGELVGDKFYSFDLLFLKGRDMRKSNLKTRLDSLARSIQGIGIKMKKFYFTDIYVKSKSIWDSKKNFPYELDGLIYTPIDLEYFNNKILKWKDDNTIDFYYNGSKLQLAGYNNKGEYVNMDFSGIDGSGTFRATPHRNVVNAIFKTSGIPPNVKNGVWQTNRRSGVGEFRFDDNQFKFIRNRPDKELANGVDASNQSWEAVMSPLTIGEISTGPGSLRQFHNEIKTKLIMKYAKNKRVLDIGSGKGEDVRKYLDAGATRVVGFDMVEEEYPHPPFMEFIKVPGPIYRVKNFVNEPTFDVININFAIHYFLQDRRLFESLLRNIHENLTRNGGVLMATVLDGKLVYQALKNKRELKTNKFEMLKNYNNSLEFNSPKFKFLGQKVGVLVKGTKYFTKPITEYLFNFDKFMRIMQEMGFEVVDSGNFKDFCDLESCKNMLNSEKEYSFKNMYFILKRTK